MEKNEHNTLEFGQLADGKLAQQIVKELRMKGVVSHIKHDFSKRYYSLEVEKPSDFIIALEHFRVHMGFAAPPKINSEWEAIHSIPLGAATLWMSAISLACYLMFSFKILLPVLELFFISTTGDSVLPEVRNGQIWRLATPMFIHFSFLHIVFNMLWFLRLGSLQENHFGVKRYLLFVFATSVLCNIAEYFVNGYKFGGMSGVVFGQIAFIWAYKRLNSDFPFSLPKFDIIFIMAWFLICLSGALFINFANTAHAVGIFCGVTAALITAILNKIYPSQRQLVQYSIGAAAVAVGTIIIEIYTSGNA